MCFVSSVSGSRCAAVVAWEWAGALYSVDRSMVIEDDGCLGESDSGEARVLSACLHVAVQALARARAAKLREKEASIFQSILAHVMCEPTKSHVSDDAVKPRGMRHVLLDK